MWPARSRCPPRRGAHGACVAPSRAGGRRGNPRRQVTNDVSSRAGRVAPSSNTHPGQGTASRRFSLAQQYLELLWVCDQEEARCDGVRPTQLWERWVSRRTRACPFGLVFRADASEPSTPSRFARGRTAPGYLELTLALDHAQTGRRADARPDLPLVFRC